MLIQPTTLIFFVNGKKIEDSQVDPEVTLLYYLRNKLRLCGTKLGCAEGGCGACTVMVSKYDRVANKIVHLPINACLARICSMHGYAVTTVEGIGSTKTRLHPVQERIAKAHGSQCGFCTPGIVMSMYTLLRNMPKPSMADLELAFQGNLCRCTGYRGIIEGYKTFTEDWELMQNQHLTNGAQNGTCGMGKDCCKFKKQNGNAVHKDEETLFDKNSFTPYDSTQEPIFPPELKLSDKYDKQELYFKGERVSWYRPTNMNDLLDLKQKYPGAKIVVGNTEVGVEVKFKNLLYPVLIDPLRVVEMVSITETDQGLKVGASVTLANVEAALKSKIKTLPDEKTRIFVQIVEMLHWFAGKQIRSVASIGGNIMTGSPISDLNPIFMASEVELELLSKKRGTRNVLMNHQFFTGYRQNVVEPDEVLLAITIPYTNRNQYFYAYKQARRRNDDIAIVNSAINVTFKDNSLVVDDINLALGGMAPTTVGAKKTKQALKNCTWNEEMLELAYKCLSEDLPLPPDAPGGMVQYRRTLVLSFFFKAFLTISNQLNSRFPELKVSSKDVSGIESFHYEIPKSAQYFQMVPNSQSKIDPVGRPVPHVAAAKHATGEAKYCDDMPFFENELYMAYVNSTKAHAKIVSIDASEALKIKGVHAFFCAKDVDQAKNSFNFGYGEDEEIFASKVVLCHGQPIGVVLADDKLIAQRAAKKVKVEYEDLQPVILSIEDAIKHNSYFGKEMKMATGNVDEVFKTAEHIVEGECRTGGQEHFYLETQSAIVVPKYEDEEVEIYCATQHPAVNCQLVSRLLDIPLNKVIVKVKRIGGAFGGKETKCALLVLPAAFAAHRLQRPVRIMLDRDEDIAMTGGRHPFYFKYKTAFDSNGKILALELNYYNNAGSTVNFSTLVTGRSMLSLTNAYNIPNVKFAGYTCKTNIASNTAFRAFGSPQAVFFAETMLRQVADYLKKDIVDITALNMLKTGDITTYKQKLENCTLSRCWEEVIESSKFHQRRQDIEVFNQNNRWKKRGIAVVPIKYGVGFGIKHLHQAGALVMVYLDGSVLLTHGGTEMGQGLHTKMIQVASRVLEISMDQIHISETATDKVPNLIPTAASLSSDMNGMAVMNACQKIKQRLEPIVKMHPDKSWKEIVMKAHEETISLSATGFYSTTDYYYDWEKHTGKPFIYHTFGTSVSEVEIDCLTGDHQIRRTDIVMDIGDSLNPGIDIGQIEGAFMQGYGLYVLEEMVFLNNGAIFSRGPGTYKIPCFSDIPLEFNVSLLKGAPNPRAIYSSKAVGEPPLILSISVFFAIKEAIRAARRDAGISETFKYDAPATAASIRMACQDEITKRFEEPKSGTYVPWNVIP